MRKADFYINHKTKFSKKERKKIMRMEHENNYANKGVAGAGLGLGIAGTALAYWEMLHPKICQLTATKLHSQLELPSLKQK